MGDDRIYMSNSFSNCSFPAPHCFGPKTPQGPLLFESAHHSLYFPKTAINYRHSSHANSRMPDRYVDELILPLQSIAPVILSNISRLYIDPNRERDCINVDEIEGDLETLPADSDNTYAQTDLWLIPTCNPTQAQPNYPKPNEDVILERLKVWDEYHASLDREITRLRENFDHTLHLSMHSYPGKTMVEKDKLQGIDIIIGSLGGTSAEQDITSFAAECFRNRGYRVLVDEIFKGRELIRQHSNPEDGRHSLQIEIERDLYMDINTFKRKPEGISRLQSDLQHIAHQLCVFMNDYTVTQKLDQTHTAELHPNCLAAE